MKRSIITILAAALALAMASPATVAAKRRPHRPRQSRIVDLPVSFDVVNVNRSKVPCQTDGQPYTIQGHLVAPRALLRRADRPVTLYLHGSTGGEWMFREPHGTRFDTATQLARRGHASVVIDQLGYDRSGAPRGDMACIGGQADIAHQIIEQLRSGTYRTSTRPGARFTRVALLGYSIGGLIAEVEAHSFGDIEALALVGWNDQIHGQALPPLVPRVATICAAGGEPKESGADAPGGYVYFWPSAEAQAADVFYDPDPRAVSAFTPLINRDPCGLLTSAVPAGAVNHLRAATIAVPVLLIQGDQDKLMGDPSGMQIQQARLVGSPEVTAHLVENAGHHLMAEKQAPVFQADLAGWLAGHGF